MCVYGLDVTIMEQHIQSLIPDYVLGLLPESDRQRLENHTAHCQGCRLALERERAIELHVRQTLQVATQPNAVRLHVLRSNVIPRRPVRSVGILRQLAPAMLLLVVLAGALVLQTARVTGDWQLPVPAFYKGNTPTATITSTPTATIAGLTRTVPMTQDDITTDPHIGMVFDGSAASHPATRAAAALPMSTPVAAATAPITN